MDSMLNNHNSGQNIFFHGFSLLKQGESCAGYAFLIAFYDLQVPLPDRLFAIGLKHKIFDRENWIIYSPRHQPDNSVYGHLVFALKYEGLDLLVLKALFNKIDQQVIVDIVANNPTGAYSRRIWFLYEWLLACRLEIADVKRGNYVDVLNSKLQYGSSAENSQRHRVRNNLPGCKDFCPLIRRTAKLDGFLKKGLSHTVESSLGEIHMDLISRAASFLLLKDSKASYMIENEQPPHNRIEKWGKIIGQAGKRPLSIDELESLQRVLITDNRFVMSGVRLVGGFVGNHDRATGMPIPYHISARADDLDCLLNGLLQTYSKLLASDFDAVLMASLIAFGFIFIHPFEDGNGRIHRYLFHHVLAEKNFVRRGLIFPISAVILRRIEDYAKVLESFSRPRLDFIKWNPTEDNNLEVVNNTIDLYRYFDATKQAEFIFGCVEETVIKTLPEEIDYLVKYDKLRELINNQIDMPDNTIDLLIRFLCQNKGTLSKRAKNKEFIQLTDSEISFIEDKYDEIFPSILSEI